MVWYVVDGTDGSGKSTVAGMLRDRLESRGRRVLVMAHPSRDTAVGRLERAMLCREGRLPVTVSTALYIMDVLRSLCVMRGRRGRGYDDVIFVRYIMAVAYLPDSLCHSAYDAISRVLPMPDVAILVDVDEGSAMGRIASRGEDLEVFETTDRLSTVRRRMLSLSDGWIVLDNDGGLEDLEGQVMSRVLGEHRPPQDPRSLD